MPPEMNPKTSQMVDSAKSLEIEIGTQRLIDLGRNYDGTNSDLRDKELLEKARPFHLIDRGRFWGEDPDFDYQVLSIEEQICLIKGLIIGRKELWGENFSVSATTNLLIGLKERDYDKWERTANWVLKNSLNPRVHLGWGELYGADSVKEFLFRRAWAEVVYAEGLYRGAEEEQELELRKKQKTESHLLRNTTFRNDLIRQLSHLTISQQLRRIADDDDHAVQLYPTLIAGRATTDVIQQLDLKTCEKLIQKLKGRHKGPWARLRRRLIKVWSKTL